MSGNAPPPEGLKYTRIDRGTFYVSSTSHRQVDAAFLAARLEDACQTALKIGAELRAAADVGVEKAAEIVAVLDTVAALSDEIRAAEFITALRAARDS